MWKTPLRIVACGLLIALGIGLVAGLLLPRLAGFGSGPPQIANTATFLRQVQTLSHLVTVKYVLEKVVILEDVKWYGESRVLLMAHGVVKAGVDLSQLGENDLKIQGKKVSIQLPAPTITDVYLDEQQTRIIERNTGLLRTYDKDLEQTARRQAVDDIRRAARSSGIYADAQDRAQRQLKALFLLFGFEEVEIHTKK